MFLTFPNLHNSTLFPTFAQCPISDPSTSATPRSIYLLATIQENMTLSTNPTFVCKDLSSASFAIVINLEKSSSERKFEAKEWKKGFTICVKGAERSGIKDGKQGYIGTRLEYVKIIPTNLEKLKDMSERANQGSESNGGKETSPKCQACGKKHDQGISKCKGCGEVWYCNKACQTMGWNENGHKGECKVLKAVREAFPREDVVSLEGV